MTDRKTYKGERSEPRPEDGEGAQGATSEVQIEDLPSVASLRRGMAENAQRHRRAEACDGLTGPGQAEYNLPHAEQLQQAVEAYFAECAKQETPPTPSGLALALGVRTSALTGEGLTLAQQAVIDRAMQRIEATMVALLLKRGGVKGMETVLDRVRENGRLSREEQLLRMTDEEIRERLQELIPRLQKAVSGQE